MMSILYSLSWEFARRVWLVLFEVVAMLVLGPLAFQGLFWLDGITLESAWFEPVEVPYHLTYLGLAFFGFAAAVIGAQLGVRERLYRLPVSTRLIAGWLMGVAVITVVVANLLTNWLYWILFDLRWPVWGPTTFLVAAILVAQCSHWSLLKFQSRRLLICAVVAVGMACWLKLRYHPDGVASAAQLWSSISAMEFATLLGVCGAAYLLALHFVGQHRCGEPAVRSLSLERIEIIAGRLAALPSLAGRQLATPAAAVRWCEWRKSWWEPIGIGVLAAAIVITAQYESYNFVTGHTIKQATKIMLLAPVQVGMILGMALGLTVWSKSGDGMPAFIATRPISDTDLSAAMLQNVLRVNFVAWSIMITACSVHTVIWMLGDQRVAEESRHLLRSSDVGLAAIPLALMASFIGGWTGTGLTASMMWTGRSRFVGTVVVSFVLLIASTPLLVRFVPDNWETPLERGIPWFCVAMIAVATIAAFATATRRRLISVRTLLLAIIAWSAEVIICWNVLPAGTDVQLASPALLTLTVAPLAAAPLAISWNRHR